MKKVLFVATVVQKHINVFHIPFLKMFQEAGYTTYVAAANDTTDQNVVIPHCDEYIEINFKRNPLHPINFPAYRKLRRLIQSNDFDIIHCHTPVGGLLGRIAARKARKKGTRVFYTAHGFHFYKGAPLKNWLIYYPAEKICSYFTDVLITINREDYALANKKMKSKQIVHIPGVGIDLSRFENVQVDRAAKRQEIGVPEDAFLLLSVGELNENKNHQVVINAIARLQDSRIHYAIAGVGDKKEYLMQLDESLGVSEQVHLLGYRKDIPELLPAADVFCFPSFREGLSVSIMEAMACGLPCVASKIRGNVDLLSNSSDFLFDPFSVDDCKNAIEKMLNADLAQVSETNRTDVKYFCKENVLAQMHDVYGLDEQ